MHRARAGGRLASGGVTVWLRGGLYQLEESLTLEQQDSGTESNPVVFRAVEGEEGRFMGGLPLPAASWAPVTDDRIRERLVESARNCVLQFDLTQLGVSHVDEPPVSFRGSAMPEL